MALAENSADLPPIGGNAAFENQPTNSGLVDLLASVTRGSTAEIPHLSKMDGPATEAGNPASSHCECCSQAGRAMLSTLKLRVNLRTNSRISLPQNEGVTRRCFRSLRRGRVTCCIVSPTSQLISVALADCYPHHARVGRCAALSESLCYSWSSPFSAFWTLSGDALKVRV